MNLPAGDGRSTRSSFARNPIPQHLVPPQPHVPPPDATSADIYLPDSSRVEIPNTIDGFLPGRVSARSLIPCIAFSDVFSGRLGRGEEKSWKSLVWRKIQEVHAPHTRAASVSLFFCVISSFPLIVCTDIVSCGPSNLKRTMVSCSAL